MTNGRSLAMLEIRGALDRKVLPTFILHMVEVNRI